MLVDEPAPIDPKILALRGEIVQLCFDATKLIRFRVFRLKKGWQDRDYSELKWMRNWLVTVIGLAELVITIRNRHPQEVWERYTKFGIRGLTEQVELNKRQQNLEVFMNKNKPPFIVKGKPSKTAKVSYPDDGTQKSENAA